MKITVKSCGGAGGHDGFSTPVFGEMNRIRAAAQAAHGNGDDRDVDETAAQGGLLFRAAGSGRKDILWKLVNDRGLDPNAARASDACTPMHLACRHGHSGSAQYLLQLGARADAADSDGRTPLHLAALYGHALTCGLLVRWRADLEALDSQGCTALHLAALYGHVGASGMLLDHGALIDATDSASNSETSSM